MNRWELFYIWLPSCISDQEENFIEDFDLEALSSHLSWDDESISSASRLVRGSESEKVTPSGQRSPSPLLQEPQMDLEADFPTGKYWPKPRISLLHQSNSIAWNNALWLFLLWSSESFNQPVQKSQTPATKSKTHKKSRESVSQRKKVTIVTEHHTFVVYTLN